MAKSGIAHADVGNELSKVEWLDEENHELIHGNSFPDTPAERQLFYRDDEHKWYIYNGSSWVDLQASGGSSTFLALTDTPSAYTGQAGKYAKVNTGETALEFDTPGGGGDMLKSVYDTDDDGVVDNSEKLEGSTKAQVQDHDPKAHKSSHEDAGADEISLAGLSGDPADTINKSLLTTAGDIIKRGASAPERLPIGSNGQVLTVASGAPAWADPGGGGGDMYKSTYDPNEDGVIALAQLDSGVCSESEADSKISTHAGNASVHHAKTADDEVYGLLRMGLDASKPAAGTAGRFYYATDTMILYRDTGGSWTEAARAEVKSRLASLFEKAHSSLSGIGASDHHSNVATITFIIDGGGSAIATGEKGHLEIPFACTITGWTILADQSGSIVVDVWKDTYANFPPTVADTIAGSEKPTLSSAQKNQDLTLTTWTTSIAAGDILAFNVDSCTTVTRVTISLKVTKA
jgi:hypothetical protein